MGSHGPLEPSQTAGLVAEPFESKLEGERRKTRDRSARRSLRSVEPVCSMAISNFKFEISTRRASASGGRLFGKGNLFGKMSFVVAIAPRVVEVNVVVVAGPDGSESNLPWPLH